MTNTLDIANIVKPLEWLGDEPRTRYLVAKKANYSIKYNIDKKQWNSFYKDLELGLSQTLGEAKNVCDAYHAEWTLSLLDQTKLQQPEPFWKPIEQCPNEGSVHYLISNIKTGAIGVGLSNYGHWSGCQALGIQTKKSITEPTHYAEIPLCEVQS